MRSRALIAPLPFKSVTLKYARQVFVPAPALRADRRHTLPKLIGGLAVGFVLAVVWVLLRELFARGQAETPADFETMSRLWRASVDDVRRLFLLRRRSV